MKRRRVKITGIGPVTPAGIGKEAFWKGILEPVSRVRPYEGLGDECGPLVAAFIDDFDVSAHLDAGMVPKGSSRQTEFGLAGAALALRDAGIPFDELRSLRSAVVTGSCLMDFGGLIASFESVNQRGAKAALPRIVHTACVGSVSASISTAFGLTDRSVAVSNQCSSGMDAVSYGYSMVANGEADIALCGGSDATMFRTPFLELRAGKWISRTAERASDQVRPFDLWRNTSALAEGCSMFVLEPESSDRPGYSWIVGQGFASDRRGKLCSGLAEAGRLALADAAIHPSQIDVLNAWGPGDIHVDRGEADAMKQIFGERLREIATTSIKGSVGSALGAAPAIQIAAAAIGQRTSTVPPTVNWFFPDPDCPMHLSRLPRAIDHRFTMVNSHGITAVNGCLILERC